MDTTYAICIDLGTRWLGLSCVETGPQWALGVLNPAVLSLGVGRGQLAAWSGTSTWAP